MMLTSHIRYEHASDLLNKRCSFSTLKIVYARLQEPPMEIGKTPDQHAYPALAERDSLPYVLNDIH